ncbi:1107_t:CDS:2, partial [Entrophospora sp. SA101]
LALKHRQNKNQKQRIIVFIGSPIDIEKNALVTLGKKMKKNNVAVDIINFGEESENNSKLEAFINAVNSGDNSHILTVPPGPHILSDALLSSAILAGEDGVPAGFAAGGGNSFEFGVDPNLDPELALALRISLEEEKARQEAKAAEVSTTSNSNQEAESSTMAIDQTIGGGSTDKAELSTIINTENQVCSIDLGKQGGEEEKEGDKDTDDVHMEELTEDEQMARALQMSMQGDGESNVKITTDDYNVMQDPEFMSELLQSLPGVDPNDPQIRNALQVTAVHHRSFDAFNECDPPTNEQRNIESESFITRRIKKIFEENREINMPNLRYFDQGNNNPFFVDNSKKNND